MLHLAPLVLAVMLRWQEAVAAAEALRLLETARPILAQGLTRDQFVITMPEFTAITRLNRTPGILGIIYMNGAGEPRWYKDPEANMRCVLRDEAREIPFLTAAPKRAFMSRAVVYARAPNGVLEIAVPFLDRGRLIGMIVLESPLRRG